MRAPRSAQAAAGLRGDHRPRPVHSTRVLGDAEEAARAARARHRPRLGDRRLRPPHLCRNRLFRRGAERRALPQPVRYDCQRLGARGVYPTLSTRRLLTMEWVDGTRLNDVDALTAGAAALGARRHVGAVRSARCSAPACFTRPPRGQPLHDGRRRAHLPRLWDDVVPRAGAARRDHRGGACTWAEPRLHRALRSVRADGLHTAATRTPRRSPPRSDALPDVLNASVAELNFKSVINKLGDVMYKYAFSLPPFYIAVIRCLGVLEGVAMEVDNSATIVKDAYPYIASRLLTDKAPQLEASLLQASSSPTVRSSGSTSKDSKRMPRRPTPTPLLAVERIADHLLSPEAGAACRRPSPMPSSMSSTLWASDALRHAYRSAAAAARRAGQPGAEPTAVLSELRDRLGSMPQWRGDASRRPGRPPRAARTARAGGSGGPDGDGGGGGVELPALASLGAQLLARPEAQRQIADLSVRLAERAVVGSLRVAFDPPPQEEAPEDDGAEAAEAAPEPPAEPPAPALRRDGRRGAAGGRPRRGAARRCADADADAERSRPCDPGGRGYKVATSQILLTSLRALAQRRPAAELAPVVVAAALRRRVRAP